MEAFLSIPGAPISKKRPRFARRGKFVSTYNCQETEEGNFRWFLSKDFRHEKIPAGIPIILTLVFTMPIPASMSKKARQSAPAHIKKPDLDNLVKFFKDCANGVLWADDSQVCELDARKVYGENPRTDVSLRWEV